MNKENDPPLGSRIVHHFHSTKPFLPCKRPLQSVANFSNERNNTPGEAKAIECSTPTKTPKSSNSYHGVLDEDLDEAFLQQVDALCEERSASKKEKPAIEEGINSRDLEAGGEDLRLDGPSNDDSVPQKYREYLRSLNDAQREAACCDTAVPLMIIAGPGSGKFVEYVEKISLARNCSFLSAAKDIFSAKISGTFKRSQLTQGRKVLSTVDMMSKLVQKEQSISVVISSAADVLPQKFLLEQRAVVDAEGGKLLNEDNDLRSVLQYLMDDVSDFLSTHFADPEARKIEEKGCAHTLKVFIDYITLRESENFRSRRRENQNSVTLTTIHQAKGLEWDNVFIVKANDSEIPLLHEYNGIVKGGATLEEERRLLYVAITRTRKKLYILYITVDCNWQLLQPSRFLHEIPAHLLEIQGEDTLKVEPQNTV